MHIEDLADEIFDRKLVKFHTHDPITTVKSALANDNQIREQRGHRPLFAQDDEGYWWLTEWSLSPEIFQKEQAALSLSEEIRQDSVQQLGSALMDVKTEALEHLALTLLERLGYHNIKVSKRSSDGDVFFTADWRQGLADVRVCVRVVSDHDWSLGESAVNDLRDTLNHYSASEGVIIHLGEVTDDAVGASRREGKSPITLLDKQTFVELLIKHGIGVKVYQNPIVTVDMDFIDALKT
jgi:restriction endonuclease Mrr